MKKILGYGMVFLLLLSLVTASKTITWPDSYRNESGVKTLTSKACGGVSSVEWSIVAWTDGSANTTNCVDQVRCRGSEDNQDWDNYSDWTATAGDVDLIGTFMSCQWNLSLADTDEENCTVSGFSAVCGGFVSPEGYGAGDFATAGIDGIVLLIGTIATLAGIIGLVIVYGFFKKKARM